MTEDQPAPPGSIAAPLNRLFATARPAGQPEPSNVEVARATGLSHQYLSELRRGRRSPTVGPLKALAHHFNVTVDYFFAEPTSGQVDAQRERAAAEQQLQDALGDPEVRALCVQAAALSPASLALLAATVRHLRTLEGLPDPPTDSSS